MILFNHWEEKIFDYSTSLKWQSFAQNLYLNKSVFLKLSSVVRLPLKQFQFNLFVVYYIYIFAYLKPSRYCMAASIKQIR